MTYKVDQNYFLSSPSSEKLISSTSKLAKAAQTLTLTVS